MTQSTERLDDETERVIEQYGKVSGGYFADATKGALRSRIRELVEEAHHRGWNSRQLEAEHSDRT